MLCGARNRATKRGLPFSLVAADIVIPVFCPVLGLRLGQNHDTAPSLDRIKPVLGYVKDNIRVISWRANTLRSNATIVELRALLADAEKIDSGFQIRCRCNGGK